MNNLAIHTKNLTKRFLSNEALEGISFEVPVGSIYGLLGPNGAGKTTMIKILVNLLTASSGYAKILDCPTSQLNWRWFQKIGYVSENQKLPEEMSLIELLTYLKPYYPTWDVKLCDELLSQLNLPLKRPIRNFSRGMKMKAAFLASLAFRPNLLILDEPFSGLDPIVREDLLHGLFKTVAGSTGTVFLSSQDVEEVERLCDWVGIMKPGHLLVTEPLDQLLRRFRRIVLTLTSQSSLDIDSMSNVVQIERSGSIVNMVHTQFNDESTMTDLRMLFSGILTIKDFPMTLREIYLVVARISN